jgi:phospholipid/cholesterol/gamma-HCH transport system substrate-binding protein
MISRGSDLRLSRVVAATALALAAVVLAWLLLSGGSSYTINAHFLDASELVSGGSVEVAGRTVGSISQVGVTPNGQADIVLSIDDASLVPLHAGTRAEIRALSQTGVANHYVSLTPGPANMPALQSGSVLPASQTNSLVGLDAILDAFGPQQRADLQELIADGDQLYAGSGSRYFNQTLVKLDPALGQLTDLLGQLADDRTEIAQLIRTGSIAAGAIASRGKDLTAAVSNTATTLEALARQRDSLADALSRAPSVLGEAQETLADAGRAVTALRPTLAEVPAAASPLDGLLERLTTTLPPATSAIEQLHSELPSLRATLAGLPALAPLAVKALNSAGRALEVARPIVRDVRFYGADLLLGIFLGLAGTAPANYDRLGHYARIEFTEPYQTVLGGPLSSLLSAPLAPDLFNLRSRLLRRCPGGNTPPAPDGSSPWIPDQSICTPADDVPLSVDFP